MTKTTAQLLNDFKVFLISQKLSFSTLKNYQNDLRLFMSWVKKCLPELSGNFLTQGFSGQNIKKYQQSLSAAKVSPSTINRRLSALRKFGRFIKDQGLTPTNPADKAANKSPENALESYRRWLKKHSANPTTTKNYLADIRHLISFIPPEKISSLSLASYRHHLNHNLKLSPATIKRRFSSIRGFCQWAVESGYLKQNPFLKKPPLLKLRLKIKRLPSWPTISNLYNAYHSMPATKYFHLGILIMFCATLGYGAFDQFFKKTPAPLAYPTALTSPNRYLSFQGRLTDSSDNPITEPTNITFKLWNHLTNDTEVACNGGGDENCLWSSAPCSIDPDQDGIFSTLLGSSCGAEIATGVFSETANVWLGIKIADDAEATPRIQIASVGYALNSATLQGYPAGTGTNAIPYIDNTGTITLAAASPTLTSTSGTFAIKGLALSITTASGSNGGITLAPDGTGLINLSTNGASNGTNITNAQMSSGSLIYGLVANNNSNYYLLRLDSGADYNTKLVVEAGGDIGIGTTDPGAKLDVVGNVKIGTLETGATDTVLIHTNNIVQQRTINSRVWGSTLVDGAGVAGYIPYWSDPDSQTYDLGQLFWDSANNRLGIGNTDPASLLSVGYGSPFQVDSTGDVIKLKNLTYTWPSSHTANGVLANNGTGTLSWATIGASGITADSLDFTELQDTLDLDNSTTINQGNYDLLFNLNGSGDLRVLDNGVDVLYVNDSGNTGIGTSAPFNKLSVAGNADITGNLGIGTTGPGTKIDVVGGDIRTDGNSYSGDLYLGYDDTSATITTNDTGEALTIDPNGTGTVYFHGSTYQLDSSGNLTFGATLTPTANYTLGSNSYTGVVNTSDWDISATGDLTGIGNLTADGTITMSGLGAGTDNSVVILDGSNQLTTDEIDSRVWGTSLVDGTGVAGYLPYFSDPDTLAYDTGQLFWNATDNRLGIGTTNPSVKLSLGADITGQKLAIYDASNDFWGFGLRSGYLDFQTQSTPKMTIKAAGEVGIGTTDPASTLQVYDTAGTANINIKGTAGTYNYSYLALESDEATDKTWQFLHRANAPANRLAIEYGDGLGNWSEHLSILTSGYVGINTTNPLAELHVSGDASANVIWPSMVMNPQNENANGYGTGIKFKLHDENTGVEASKWAGVAAVAQSTWANTVSLAFYTQGNVSNDPTEKMRIDPIGRVGIGVGNTSPSEYLHVRDGNLRIDESDASGYAKMTNWTSVAGRYIPTLWGYEDSDLTGVGALGLIGVVDSDYMDDSAAVIIDGRNSGSALSNRHLLQVQSYSGTPKFVITASGDASVSGTLKITYAASAPTLNTNGQMGLGYVSSTNRIYFYSNGARQYVNADAAGDFSEFFQNEDQSLDTGEAVTLNPQSGKVRRSTIENDPNIIGIVSAGGTRNNDNQAGERGNDPSWTNVGLMGQLGARVSTLNGSIKAGDKLTSSSIPGVLMRTDSPGTVLAKALEEYQSDDPFAIGLIMVYVNQAWFGENSPPNSIKLSDLPNTENSEFKILNGQEIKVASVDSQGNATFAGELRAKKIIAEEIVGLEGKFGELLAATVSAQQITQNITQITQIIEAPELPESTPSADLAAIDIEKMVEEILKTTSEATAPAQLLPTDGDGLIIKDQLTVLGNSSLADTSIAGYLNIGGSLSMIGNSLNTLAGPLEIQNLGLNGIEILAGKITIDQSGDIDVQGNLTVHGRLALNELTPLPDQNLTLNLSSSPESTPTGGFASLIIKGVDQQTVASIDASGSATFNKLNIAAAAQPTTNNQQPTTITANTSIGQATLPLGSTEITLESAQITGESLVYLTPTTSTSNKVLYVKAKDLGWVKIGLDTPAENEIKFNWWVIN